jgi:putative DNA primase/helicase
MEASDGRRACGGPALDQSASTGRQWRDPVSLSPRNLTELAPPARVDATEFDHTGLGNGQLFAAMHRGGLRYVWDEKVWLEWRGGRWRRDTSGAAERAGKQTVQEMLRQASELADSTVRKNAVRWALQSEGRQRIVAMLSLAASEPEIVVTTDELDTNPYLFSCGNGTLDLRTGELRPAEPTDLITLGTDIDYDPDARRQRWLQFLAEVFADDQELIAFVKRTYGSCLTGDVRDRALFIEYGSRFNGKSTLNKAVQLVLGDFAHTAPIRVVMRSRQSEIPNEIAALRRKRFVVVAETADGQRLDENRVKALTGGDEVPARALYREWFTFRPEYKLFLYTNFKPKVDGLDGAVWDRIRLIPFGVSFENCEDKEIGAKLGCEAEGILAWLVEGCRESQQQGLGTCEAVEQATHAYRNESDVISRFVNECCDLDDEFRVPARQLRDALADYCSETGDDVPPPTTVGRWLAERNVREARLDGKRAYRGIGLREPTP